MAQSPIHARQEAFARLVFRGVPPYKAYPQAGYKPDKGNPYRLTENDRVKRRLAQLQERAAVKASVTVETIAAQLDEDRAFAKRVEQAGPALQATVAKAKLYGLLVERKETGQPGDFANLQSADEVLELVKRELGEETARALASVLAAHQAEIVDRPAAAVPIEPTNEAPGTVN